MQKITVDNMTNDIGNPVVNKFVIKQIDGNISRTIFQSYKSIIAVRVDDGDTYQIYLDSDTWDYSRTTGKYRNKFLGEKLEETKKKISSGEYKLVDLNTTQ